MSWIINVHLEREMYRFTRILTVQVAISLLLATNTQAAFLTNVQGEIFVTRDGGVNSVNGVTSLALARGDRVRANAGSADRVYDNGCSTKVGPTRTVTVQFTPPSYGQGGLKDGASAESSSTWLSGEAATFGVPAAGGALISVGLSTTVGQRSVSP
jgi:hypothetical protein